MCNHEWTEITTDGIDVLVFRCGRCGIERRAALTFGAALTELSPPVFRDEVGTRFKHFLPGLNPPMLSPPDAAKLKALLADLRLDDMLS